MAVGESHISMRLDNGVLEEIDLRAEAQGISRSRWIRNVIVEAIARQPDPNGPQNAKEQLKELSGCEHPAASLKERKFQGMIITYCLECGSRVV